MKVKKSSAKKIAKSNDTKLKIKNQKNGKSNKKVGDEEEIEDENNPENEFESLLLPGQKFPTPPQGDASRAFYESLLEQKPESLMALRWCIDYGCLEHDKADKGLALLESLKKKNKKNQ